MAPATNQKQTVRSKPESIPLGPDSSSNGGGGSTENGPSNHRQQPQPPGLSTFKAQARSTWTQHRAAILMLASTFCGVSMNTCARFLEHGGGNDDPSHMPMHPMQLLFTRMLITSIFCRAYMRCRPEPQFPWGWPEIRTLLLVRGVAGFFGIWGMWQSMMYLPLAEATVITFLVPSVTGYVCHVLIREPFSRPEQIASFVALAGVVLIARPSSFLGAGSAAAPADGSQNQQQWASGSNNTYTATFVAGGEGEEVTPAQRLGAIGMALLGVVGSAGAVTAIRQIGARANPLIPTYYFGWICTVISLAMLALGPILNIGQPTLRFSLPHGAREWLLLCVICVAGFLTQFLLTAALGGVTGGSVASKAATRNRAMSMTYTAMIFAAVSDKLVFDIEMGVSTFVGSGLIIGSAVWAAFSKKEETGSVGPPRESDLESGTAAGGHEDARLLSDGEESSEEEEVEEEDSEEETSEEEESDEDDSPVKARR